MVVWQTKEAKQSSASEGSGTTTSESSFSEDQDCVSKDWLFCKKKHASTAQLNGSVK